MSDRLFSAQDVADRYGLTLDFVYHNKRLRKYARPSKDRLFWIESDLEEFERNRPSNRGFNLIHRKTVIRQKSIEEGRAYLAEAKKNLRFDIK